LFLAAAVVLVFMLLGQAPAEAREAVVKSGGGVNVRGGPGTGYALVGNAAANERLPVLETSGDWVKVRLADGRAGWVAGWLVEVRQTARAVPAQSVQAREAVAQKAVNIRSGPGTSHGLVGSAAPGARLPVLETSGDWVKVRLPDGKTGWAAGWLVQVRQVPLAAQAPAARPSQSLPVPPIQAIREVVIKSGGVNVRSGPGASHGLVTTLAPGARLPLLEVSGHWVKVRLPDGKTGWVAAWLVNVRQVAAAATPAPAPAIGTQAVVNGSVVYIRGGPGTTHSVVTQVSRGDRLGVLERSGDWYKVSAGNIVGWVAGWLVHVDRAEASTPELDPAPEFTPGPPVILPWEQTPQEPSVPENPAPPVTPGSGPETDEPAEEAPLKHLEVTEHSDRTVVRIEGSNQLNVNVFTLSSPDRLVVDITGAEPGGLPEQISANTGVVSAVRTGWFSRDPAVTRVVVDLKKQVFFESKVLDSGKTIELTLYVPRPGQHLPGKVIVLDPGHGGKDPGAIGPTGLQEKTVTLDVTLRTAQILRDSGATVILTRESDIFLDLPDRVIMSDAASADIFVSIHMNANPSRDKDGTSTYFRRDSTGSRRASSDLLARMIQTELVADLGRRDIGVLQANFAVLRTQAPAALAEVAFISNYAEESLMRQDSFRDKSAGAIARAINNYFAAQQ
jgi:N-acetylmuramoyl-L-alanine amidase